MRNVEAPAKLKVMVLGIRGMPNVQGGVETHAEQLYSRLAAMGCDVVALVRTPFVPKEATEFAGVRLRRIWAPRQAGLEALLHSVLGALYAGWKQPDILHIHNIGPAIVTPLARLFGLKVVVTYHSQNYEHEKWSGPARWLLRTGEMFGMRCSQARIAISRLIANVIQSRQHRDSYLIPNGVVAPEPQTDTTLLTQLGLRPGEYLLQVGRISQEKGQLDLIRGYAASGVKHWKLVLVGGLDESSYGREVVQAAAEAGVVLAGFRRGAALAQLYTHAAAFVLPSYHEGLPIALLEALSYGLPVLASNIPPNLEVGLDADSYFPVGDVAALGGILQRLCAKPRDEASTRARRNWVLKTFDWNQVARQTLDVYRSIARH